MPEAGPDRAAPTAAVRRELLVRCLEVWAPAAVQRARRATYVHGYADSDDGRSAEAALRVFADLADLVRGRELTMLAVAAEPAGLAARLAAVGPETGAGLAVHQVVGDTDAALPVALRAAGARGAPLFAFLDATDAAAPPALATVGALGAGKPATVLLVIDGSVLGRLAAGEAAESGDRLFGGAGWRAVTGRPQPHRPAFLAAAYREALATVGFPLVTAVELVADGSAAPVGELVVFATTAGKSLEAFKEAIWAVDEYAGVRYRDPGDPERHLLDISLTPHPGPLRRELLRHIAEVGAATVTELRTFTLTDTVYRAADATRVIGALVTAGAVTRQPESGRLGGDVVIDVRR